LAATERNVGDQVLNLILTLVVNSIKAMKKAKFIFPILFLISSSIHLFSQASWDWARSTGSLNPDYGNSVSVDSVGNSYIAGYFDGPTISFGSITITNSGTHDNMLLAKYDPSGNALWAKCAQGNADCYANSVSSDKQGKICITGYFNTAIMVIDNDTLINRNSSGNSSDIFILKCDSAGNILWARSAGGQGLDGGSGTFLDNLGNCYVSGTFNSASIIFQSDTLYNADPTGSSPDIFLAKYDVNGNLLWAKTEGGAAADLAGSVAGDDFGNSYITGSFQSATITFGSTTLTNSGAYGDIFIVKYDPLGNVLWAKSATGTDGETSNCVAIDKKGNSFITGFYASSTLNFGTFSLSNSTGYPHTFIAKYDSNGNVRWVKSCTSTRTDFGNSVAVDNLGYCYLTGVFEAANMTIASTTLINADNTGNTFDIFLTKYDSLGNNVWAQRAGGNNDDAPFWIDVDAYDVCYMTGYFRSPTIAFGSNVLTNGSTTFAYQNLFLARLVDPLSIKTLQNGDQVISLFPNPSSGIFHLSEVKGLTDVLIYDSFGRLVKQETIDASSSTIDLTGIANGIYLARFTQKGIIIGQQKLIIN